jgi:hypothetical protein
MSETSENDSAVETGNEERYGTTVADDRHVGDAEADEALNTDELEEELPPEDPDFVEDDEEFA